MARKRKRIKLYDKPQVDRIMVSMVNREAAATFKQTAKLEADPSVWYEKHRRIYCRSSGKLKDFKPADPKDKMVFKVTTPMKAPRHSNGGKDKPKRRKKKGRK